MIVQKEFLNEIKLYFNINAYEVKLWTALLSRGIATAGELADISGVPRSRCYDVLESLEKKGFIIQKIGKPIKYIAVQPEVITERVKKQVNIDAEQQMGIIENIKKTNVFKELELLHKTGIDHVDPSDLTNSISGRDNLYRLMKEMLERAKSSVTIATTETGLKRKTPLLRKTLKALQKKGVKISLIVPSNTNVDKSFKNIAKIKNVKSGVRFLNIDDKEILFMLTSDEVNPNYDSGVWVKSKFFTNALQGLFE
jgi:sugar-specific transcriptional regulator TrmB